MTIRMLGLCFLTVTPCWVTPREPRWDTVTRFCVRTFAVSWTPTWKLTSSSMRPSLVFDDCM